MAPKKKLEKAIATMEPFSFFYGGITFLPWRNSYSGYKVISYRLTVVLTSVVLMLLYIALYRIPVNSYVIEQNSYKPVKIRSKVELSKAFRRNIVETRRKWQVFRTNTLVEHSTKARCRS